MPGLAKRRAPKSRAQKKTARPQLSAVAIVVPQNSLPVYARRIRGILDGVQNFSSNWSRTHSSTPRSRQLKSAITGVGKQMRKRNIVTPQLINSLGRIDVSLRGISSAPKSVRSNIQGLYRFLRENVRKDVISFLTGLQKHLHPVHYQLAKMEHDLGRSIKGARGTNWFFRVDPMIRRQLTGYLSQIRRFRTKWNSRLNRLALHGNKDVQRQVACLKAQVNEMTRLINRNISLINQASRIKNSKTRTNGKVILTKGEITRHRNNWQKIEKQLENFRIPVETFVDQLRAVKTV